MKKWLLILLAMVFMASTAFAVEQGEIKVCKRQLRDGSWTFQFPSALNGNCGHGWTPTSINGMGIQGPQGIPGPQGIAGANGINGVSGYQIITFQTAEDTAPYKWLWMYCPEGKKLVDGGYAWQNGQSHLGYSGIWSYPTPQGGQTYGTGWSLEVFLDPADYDVPPNWALYGYIICVFAD